MAIESLEKNSRWFQGKRLVIIVARTAGGAVKISVTQLI
jgi:hypothetical protein